MRPILTAFFAATALATATTALSAQEADGAWRHATSLVEEEAKYPADFAHFDYVNPDAPKGGVVRMSDVGTFDSLNFVPPRGSEPARPRAHLRHAHDVVLWTRSRPSTGSSPRR
jgi:microcin C transport system substrate-binding protein